MIRMALGAVPPGAILARTLYTPAGQPVLRAGHPLTDSVLARLDSFGIEFVWVEEPALTGLEPVEPLQPVTWLQLRQLLHDLVAAARAGEPSLPPALRGPLLALAGRVADELEALAAPPLPYAAGPDPVSRWVAGTLNRAVLAGRLALAGPYRAHVRDFVLAALLQDVGIWLEAGAWTRPGARPGDQPASWAPCQPLAAGEPDHGAAERHVARSLRWLSGVELGGLVRALIAQHHERLDGTGYPEGLRGSAFHPAARRMAAAVAYTLAVEGCSHRPAWLPHEAYEWLLAEGSGLWDAPVLKELAEVLFPYPVGTLVQVDYRDWGVVVDCSGARRLRPRVRMLPHPPPAGPGGVTTVEEVDLLEARTRQITGWSAAAGSDAGPGPAGEQGPADPGDGGRHAPGTGGETA